MAQRFLIQIMKTDHRGVFPYTIASCADLVDAHLVAGVLSGHIMQEVLIREADTDFVSFRYLKGRISTL